MIGTISQHFEILILIWFLGWGFVILRFPVQCYRILSLGRYPTPVQLKREKFVGYMALAFGAVFIVELVFGMIR